MGRVGFDAGSFFPWEVTRVPPYVRRPFPSKENRQILERDDLGPPRGSGDRFGIPKPSPQGGGTSHGVRRLHKLLECCLMSRSLGLQLLSQLFNRPGITRHQGMQAARRGRLPFRGPRQHGPPACIYCTGAGCTCCTGAFCTYCTGVSQPRQWVNHPV
jgi:hypothetical protein